MDVNNSFPTAEMASCNSRDQLVEVHPQPLGVCGIGLRYPGLQGFLDFRRFESRNSLRENRHIEA
jgi:hypothetical protein